MASRSHRDDDAAFSEIVAREFNENWSPPPAQPVTPPPAPAPPEEFHLNLYDDEESYRAVDPDAFRLAPATRWGLVAVAVGVIVTILLIAGVALPRPIGWLGVFAFAGGVGLCLWQFTHGPDDSDGEPIV
ncbi:MAG: hypothetical protein LBM23_09680 [Propionibacteriaceae bacterium]|jgi:hypothetical protein|nr:hypothetical protein [Propionibacteriaceae bacterium]